jgi:Programmed cell death protein 2, C-terminal putative domain
VLPSCCQCGTTLQLELQILSSVLHVLRVDDYSGGNWIGRTNPNDPKEPTLHPSNSSSSNSMDWGNIAIYTCPNVRTCMASTDAYCIVQDSVDGRWYSNLNNGNSSTSNANTTTTSSDSHKNHHEDDTTTIVGGCVDMVVEGRCQEDDEVDDEDDSGDDALDGGMIVDDDDDNDNDDDIGWSSIHS